MAEVNLAPGAYGSIIMQPVTHVVAGPASPSTLLSTSASEAAYISAIHISNKDSGTWVCTLKVTISSVTWIVKEMRLAKRNATGGSANILEGAPLYLPESATLTVITSDYIGPTGAQYGVDVTASWAKILPP